MNGNDSNKIICFEDIDRLLYIDSDKSSYDEYFNFFKSKFSDVSYASNLKTAKKMLQEKKFDIVITDIEFDNENIYDFIKEENLTSNLMVIIFSKTYTNELRLKISELDIYDYINKPVDEYTLSKLLTYAIEKYVEENSTEEENIKVKQYNELLSKNGIFSKTDKNGVITYVNDMFCQVTGYTQNELVGRKHSILKHPANPLYLYQNLWNKIKGEKKEWQGVFKNKDKRGNTYYQKSIIKPICNSKGDIVEFLATRNAIDSIITTKEQLIKKIDTYDLAMLVLIQIENYNILDKFYNISVVSQIEEIFGYELLCYVPNEFIFEKVYSLGEGRYALLGNFYEFEKSVTDIDKYFKNFIKNVKNSTLVIDDIEYDLSIFLSYSFGKHMLFEDARFGLTKALEKKTNIEYSNDLSIYEYKEARKNMETISMVKIALDNYNIISYFQPIINNKTKEIDKYESLVRLINQEGEILSPYHFLDISKKGTYYSKITQRVLTNSFKMLNIISTKISMNISSLDIENEEIRSLIFKLLKENEENAHNVVFELLEDENVKDFAVIEKFITKVKSKGVQIAIDDFGAGYSNFERLLKFQPDILKIDGSLIRDIVNDKYSRSVVETIVMFAKKQNIQTIAEFVENEDIFNVLTEIGIDYSQGYYFGRPQSKEEITNS